MMKNFFFSHPIEASLDPRMEAMEEKLHGKGAGVYWYIREKMSFFSNNRCRLKQLKPFATKYYTYRLMEQVVLETDLFDIDGDVITPRKLACELDPDTERTDTWELENGPAKPRKTTAKNGKTTARNGKTNAKNNQKTAISDENRTKNDENPAENNGFSAKNEEKTAKNGEKLAKNEGKTAENSGKSPLKPLQKEAQSSDNKASDKNLDAKSNTNTSPIYKERKKEREKDDDVVIKGKTTTTTATTPPRPVESWRQYVANLRLESEWGETLCMKIGFGRLLAKHWEEAKEFFRQHLIVNASGYRIDRQEEAQSYFASFVNSCSATSKALQSHLLALERSAPAPDDPYRYEQRQNGFRTYNGRRIPADAPPRPDDHSLWNDRLKRWEPEF